MNFELADLLEDDVEVLELIEVGVPSQVYDRNEYFFSFDELAFYKRFRLTKKRAFHVLEQIEKDLGRPYNRNNSIPPINQLLVALRFFAIGNHLLSIADFGGMHVSTVSRIVSRVATGIAKLYRKYIKIPSTSSEVSQYMQYNFTAGDSAYPQKPYLMTPLLSPRDTAEQLYNESQIRTRGPIEKSFGILKRRFPVLAYGCRLQLKTTLIIIVATCVLHNILRYNGVSLEPPESVDFDPEDIQNAINSGEISCTNISQNGNDNQTSSNCGMQKRKDLINNYFRRL
ncbi:uncharacterized protein LOC129950444 [Eupeodes corollae]|uniref:uncharacterized protein LOC129950444 n=1 Tax=Eupeodes corollae TaxID=290404 RepID=UPI002493387F|nr:uncharacterized protein LOC129950444 [Eupeodes corollae]